MWFYLKYYFPWLGFVATGFLFPHPLPPSLLDLQPVVGLLDHVEILCAVFKEMSALSCAVAALAYVPSSSVKDLPFPHIPPAAAPLSFREPFSPRGENTYVVWVRISSLAINTDNFCAFLAV